MNYSPPMTRMLIEHGVLAEHPFTLLDIGCSGGLHPIWKTFGNQISAYGIDPQSSEVNRLQAEEKNPNVHYHSYFIGVNDSHPFRFQQDFEKYMVSEYYRPWERLSCAYAQKIAPQVQSQANPIGENLTSDKISVTDFVEKAQLESLDFIKIDTDGDDLEVAISSEEIIRPTQVLGYLIETNYMDSHLSTANNFANIDKFMKRNGFVLFDMTVNRYSRKDLPAKFESKILAQTVSGQPIWGDLLYARDAGSPFYGDVWGTPLSWHKALKLACLLEMFSLPDCAAEVINSCASEIGKLLNPVILLNTLTPNLVKQDGQRVTYEEYTRYFREDPSRFFPD